MPLCMPALNANTICGGASAGDDQGAPDVGAMDGEEDEVQDTPEAEAETGDKEKGNAMTTFPKPPCRATANKANADKATLNSKLGRQQ
eukprot:CAMPEP_0115572092 /NCGR_PEP_ID=MMETSP0272-20121206/292_1 /TAXON_ID=71861 /ORGANISM="Scrippsiella trochoidea, Strain CCMP3099" /LENGTH=87 /DNA_ID=CAMNT_0003006689 /DNA_START=681 /DNA_END=944 /DNA_ORIENTATION=-